MRFWRGCAVVLLMLFALAAVPVSAAENLEFMVKTDKEVVEAGDTVTCTVSIGPVENLFGLKLKVNLPEGLTMVEGSGAVSEDLIAKLSVAKVEFVETTGVFIIGPCEYTSTSETTLFQFQCTAAEDAPESIEILLEIDPENVFDRDYNNIGYTVSTARLQVHEACQHEWVEADADDNGHWFDCKHCDLSEIQPHLDEDADGRCDVCGYKTKETKKTNPLLVIIMVIAIAGVAVAVVILRKKPRKKPRKKQTAA